MKSSVLLAIVSMGLFCLITSAGCDSGDTVNDTPVVASNTQPVAVETTEPSPENPVEPQDPQVEKQEQGGTESVKKWLGDRLKDVTDTGSDAAEAAGNAAEGSLEWANEMYKELKKQGLTTAGSAGQWVAEDYQSMGAWEYKMVEIDLAQNAEATETRLNELGRLRWECFQVTPHQSLAKHIYYFKRPKKSYLKHIPLKDVLKLVPLMDGNE